MPNDPGCTGSSITGSLVGPRCDGDNEQGFKANIALPQNDNFAVVRIDHDFGSKWHFNGSYRYYKLTRATTSQVDIGGVFPGGTLGTPVAVSSRPQQPWYLVAGLTTNITSNTTNDFHFSYLRNFWSWANPGGVVQFRSWGTGLTVTASDGHVALEDSADVNDPDTSGSTWYIPVEVAKEWEKLLRDPPAIDDYDPELQSNSVPCPDGEIWATIEKMLSMVHFTDVSRLEGMTVFALNPDRLRKFTLVEPRGFPIDFRYGYDTEVGRDLLAYRVGPTCRGLVAPLDRESVAETFADVDVMW